jgi:hypothetical protein
MRLSFQKRVPHYHDPLSFAMYHLISSNKTSNK